MRVSGAKQAYIRAYFRRFTDARLGKALGLAPGEVGKARKRLKLERTEADRRRIRENRGEAPPEFTGALPALENSVRLAKWDCVVAAASALIALGVYISTLPPTVTGEDSGELIVAAYTLGIPHPPGYPVWCLLVHPFTYLPFESVATSVAFSSSVFAAMTVFLLCLLVIKVTGSRIAGVGAALVWAFHAEFWEQAVIAEVYTLNTLFMAACILLLVMWYETRRNFFLYSFAFTYGLSLGNHHTMLLLGPVFLLFVLYVDRAPWRRWKPYVTAFVCSVVPLAVYLYLPLRSLADPPVDWGNPETWDTFWAHVRREQFAFLFSEQDRSFNLYLRQLWVYAKLFVDGFTPWLAWLPVAGLVTIWWQRREMGILLFGLFLVLAPAFILIQNYGLDKQEVWLNNTFLIPSFLIAAMFLGSALEWLASLKVRGLRAGYVAVPATLACAFVPLLSHYWQNDKSDYWFAHDYGRNVLESLEPDAIYLPSSDHATFPAMYLQSVEGLRPDVAIANKYGYVEKHLYADMPAEIQSRFRAIPTDAEQRFTEEWIIRETDRPVYFTEKRAFANLADVRLETAGLVYRVVKPDEAPAPRDTWSAYSWHTLNEADTRGEYTAELILADYHFSRGRELLAEGKQEEGLASIEKSIDIAGATKEGLNNAGTLAAEHGLLETAAAYYERAAAIDSRYPVLLRNWGRVMMQLERYEAAALILERLRETGEADVESRMLLSRAWAQSGQTDNAVENLEALTREYADDAGVMKQVGLFYLNDLGSAQAARAYLTRSLELDPDQLDVRTVLQRSLAQDAGVEVPGVLPPSWR